MSWLDIAYALSALFLMVALFYSCKVHALTIRVWILFRMLMLRDKTTLPLLKADFDRVTPRALLWRAVTFRDPMKLYSKEIQELMK